MSDPTRPIPEEDLHAWIDGQLAPERQAAVLRYLQEQPDVARRVDAWRDQREALRAAFAVVAAEPVPPRLELDRLIQQRLERRRLPWRAAASVLLAFGLGGVGGWFLRGGQAPPAAAITLLAQQAVANHVVYTADRRRPTELGAQQRDDLARWVSNRLNHQVAPPDLSADGYSYMGGRLAATPDGPAGLFMYDDPQGVRLTVFVLPLNAAATMPIQHVDFAHVDGCAWIDNSVGYTVVGKLPPPELRRIAELVRRQLG
ncbi:MAG TPA: anti-sigma factor [Acetobacteraceae bacterium]|nr:anti-sigma factor [Acetobacteraceae bacterium]